MRKSASPGTARRGRKQGSKKASSKKGKVRFREYTILIEPARDHGYWVYCPAVTAKRLRGATAAEAEKKMVAYLTKYLGKLAAAGKPLPKNNVRIVLMKIEAPRS
jgi:predicted RNase H-like HicB family nuclease